MKIALITDQHLDGRKGSLAFWNYFQKFYDEIFFPTLEKEGIRTIIDLGDTFDNRKSMDYNTFNRVDTNYFQRLKDYQVHMILGNHCTYYKNTNKINSTNRASFGRGQRPKPRASVSSRRAKSGDPIQLPDRALNR